LVPYDWQVHDTYFVVAHFHYVLIGGMLFPILGAVYYWMPLMTGRLMSSRLGAWAFALIFIGFTGVFLPMHLTGLRGMPRRVYTYDASLGVNGLNLSATIFAFVFGAGVLVMIVDFFRHRRHGPAAGNNPWNAPSLEWVSRGAPEGFRSVPVVESRYPLWEQENLEQNVTDARGYLPDAPTVQRESLMTSPITGEPEQILRLPGPSWIPFGAALLTAVFMTALTLKLTWLGIVSGTLAVAVLLTWMWNRDNAYPQGLADAGLGLALPLYTNDNRSVGWWAMVVLLIADSSLTLSLVFAYLFLWTTRPAVWPPDGSQVPDLATPALLGGLIALAYVCFEAADRLNTRDKRGAVAASLAVAFVLVVAALIIGGSWPSSLGIDPTRHSYGASVWTLLGWVGVHAAMGACMALWCLARLWRGMINSWRCVTLRVCLLWWRFTVAAAAVVLALVAGFPYAFR
jgi:cytochrome c oxidase subunit I+III